MKILSLILSEIVGMFVDDEFLALAILAVVAAAAAFAFLAEAAQLVTGVVLLIGCVAVLLASCVRAVQKELARRR
jgi:hypothetical protein